MDAVMKEKTSLIFFESNPQFLGLPALANLYVDWAAVLFYVQEKLT
jgi:hypothetical protein